MTPIRLALDTVSSEELRKLCGWIASGSRLTMGPLTEQFETAFAEYLGTPNATFVNSGSSANLLALYALMEAKGSSRKSIIVPAISWATTVAPAMQLGMDVSLCDCDRSNLGLDLDHFSDLCRTKAPEFAMLVHVLGHPNSMKEIHEICEKYGVTLVEDACEALGSSYGGRKLGIHGAAGTFSFYYGHQMSTIEGGMVVVQDRKLHNIVKSMRAHGWARDLDADVKAHWEREFSIDEFRSLYTFYYPGFNCRPTDLNACLGLTQLAQMEHVTQVRERNYLLYKAGLEKEFWVQTSEHDVLCSFAFGAVVENRLDVFHHLRQCGIETRPLICGNIGRQPFWTKRYGPAELPNADVIHEDGLYLPNHANLSPADVNRVVHEFRKVAIPSSRLQSHR